MKKPLSLVCLLLAFSKTDSQNSYSFSKLENQAYAELAGDVTVPAFNANGLYVMSDFQGETFKFYNLGFTFGGLKTIAIGEYPFLRVDNDSSLVIADAAFTYADTIDAATRVSYKVAGAPGSRTLTVQYKNFKLREGQPGNYINVQIRYAQLSGVIELLYGPVSANNASGFNTVTGPQVGIFYSPDDFTGCYEKLWCEGSPTNIVLDSLPNYGFSAMSGVPPEGTVYRFTPRFMQPPPTNTTAVAGFNAPQLAAWPSPSDDEFILRGTSPGSAVRVLDTQGRVVSEFKVPGEKNTIRCAEWPEGIYLLEVNSGHHQSHLRLPVCHR